MTALISGTVQPLREQHIKIIPYPQYNSIYMTPKRMFIFFAALRHRQRNYHPAQSMSCPIRIKWLLLETSNLISQINLLLCLSLKITPFFSIEKNVQQSLRFKWKYIYYCRRVYSPSKLTEFDSELIWYFVACFAYHSDKCIFDAR